MKCLLLNCKNFRIAIDELSNRPAGIKPEAVSYREQKETDCVVVLITIEKSDTIKSTGGLVEEIEKMSKDVGHSNVVLLPFAHLCNDSSTQSLSGKKSMTKFPNPLPYLSKLLSSILSSEIEQT